MKGETQTLPPSQGIVLPESTVRALGLSNEDQQRIDERIEELREAPYQLRDILVD